MNISVINRTIATIERAAPERVAMKTFFSQPFDWCNTTACIAGWVCLTYYKEGIRNLDVEYRAELALGIEDTDTSRELFFMDYASQEYVEDLGFLLNDDTIYVLSLNALDAFDRLPPAVRKQAAINVLTILRDTNKVDWLTAIREAKAAKA